MTWWGWVLLAGYITGYFYAFRRIAGQMAWHFCAAAREGYPLSQGHKKRPDGEQWFGAILCALLFSLVWPLSITVAHGLQSSDGATWSGFYVPPTERERIHKQRIAELEREVGLR